MEVNNLCHRFSDVIHRIGMPALKHPIFYNAPVGIRFEIGGDQDIYLDDVSLNEKRVNPNYVSAALNRVKTIYTYLPYAPNILRVDTYPDEEDCQQESTIERLKGIGLPHPHEQKSIFCPGDDVGETFVQLQSYWDLWKEPISPDIFLEEIIKADIGGISSLASNVYFVNTEDAILFHLYDDRGADLVAEDLKLLRPIFERFNGWILDYDRERMNKTFTL